MKTIKLLTISLIFFGLGNFLNAQDFHASTTKVEFEGGTLKLTAKFFTDDIEKAVGASVGSKDAFDSKAKGYCSGNLSIKVNGNPVNLVYIGSQTSDKSTRLYLKVDGISNIKEIEIKNAMLISTFPDQQNLVTFDINGVRKSFTAKKGSETGKQQF